MHKHIETEAHHQNKQTSHLYRGLINNLRRIALHYMIYMNGRTLAGEIISDDYERFINDQSRVNRY